MGEGVSDSSGSVRPQALPSVARQPSLIPPDTGLRPFVNPRDVGTGVDVTQGYDIDGPTPSGKPTYETKLNPSEETQFQQWKSQNAPNDSGADYDLRGAFKANLNRAENGHFDDTFKKPNHPTFSNQSQYSTPDNVGGVWGTDANGKTTFTPSPANLKSRSPQELQNYFKQREPDAQLILPSNNVQSPRENGAVPPGRLQMPRPNNGIEVGPPGSLPILPPAVVKPPDPQTAQKDPLNFIIQSEAQRNKRGQIVEVTPPSNDGGGKHEIAGFTEKYNPNELRVLENTPPDQLPTVLHNLVDQKTARATQYSEDPGVQGILRDTIFHRGDTGAQRIVQIALGQPVTGKLSPQQITQLQQLDPKQAVDKLTNARKIYEANYVGYRPNLDRGLQDRFKKAQQFYGSLAGAQQ